jgi:xanthine dehydrogenase accessory factor
VELYFEVVVPGSAWVKVLIHKLKYGDEAVLQLPINEDAKTKGLPAFIEIPLHNNEFHLVIFGAGHVARALVNFLLPLPCTITWVDERDEMWTPESLSSLPMPLPEKINPVCCDSPEAEVAHAPVNSYFLVMTHDHSLDQKLCEQILKRNDFQYFGMIGSRSKRLTFEKRLVQRGISHQQLARMTCPIGLPGIIGKAPEIVALSVAAELMQIYSQCLNQSIAINKSSNA